jgi:hypothetical protein
MKTVRMFRDFDYRPTPKFLTAFKGGKTYSRIPEAAVKAIIEAKAGEIVTEENDAGR